VSPSGRFLYASNRGHKQHCVVFIDAEKGTLTAVGVRSQQGKTRTTFAIDPTGAYLGRERTPIPTALVVFRIDWKTGRLTPTGQVIGTDRAPACVVFAGE